MDLKNKFWLFTVVASVLILTVVGLLLTAFWHQLSPAEQTALKDIVLEHFGLMFLVGFLMAGGAVIALDAIFNNYVIPLNKLAEEVTLIATVNPSHRVVPQGLTGFVRLAQRINEAADRLQEMERTVEEKIREASSALEREKNVLEGIISELTEGVVACNLEGEILLYNRRAKLMLYQKSQYGEYHIYGGEFIGLGRSIFGIINRSVIQHALDELRKRLQRGDRELVVSLVTTVAGNQLLRIQLIPIVEGSREITGFIGVLRDITERVEKDSHRGSLLQSLTETTRSSLASIRAASENLLQFSDMPAEQQRRFIEIVRDESLALSRHLEEATASKYFQVQWPLERMRVGDLMWAIKREVEEKTPVAVTIDRFDEGLWVRVGTYSIVHSARFIMDRVHAEMKVDRFRCRAAEAGKFMSVDLVWKGPAIRIDRLKDWERQRISFDQEIIPLSLREIVKRHGGEVWSRKDKDSENAYFRFLLPAAEPSRKKPEEPEPASEALTAGSRPEFYDFDLFTRPVPRSSMEDRPLSQLMYTVFDTETTGLNPRGGDEIISFGAVRVLNGRILYDEVFDQLVDPRRNLPRQSMEVHGISPEMLQGQPTIDKVLPLFHQFVQDTVLVAHNAAFDMLLLQLKEEPTGVRFTNPVLDTLLLSAVVHPSQKDHNLEGIARRMGVDVRGRHTALGDALVTAEMFLKIVPLLEHAGIRTLGEALAASKKTYYARIKY